MEEVKAEDTEDAFARHIKDLLEEALRAEAGAGRAKRKKAGRRKALKAVLRVTWDLEANTYHVTYSPEEYDRAYTDVD